MPMGSTLGGRQVVARIWSLHPKYLDARGLVALWREGLLAQAVLTKLCVFDFDEGRR
jgi:hypothetical protein